MTSEELPEDLLALQTTNRLNMTPPKMSHLTRQAHQRRLSSKKKPSSHNNNLLNKLFCQSPSQQDDEEEENETENTEPNRNDISPQSEQGCNAQLEKIADSLTLEAEGQVRETIQESLRDACHAILEDPVQQHEAKKVTPAEKASEFWARRQSLQQGIPPNHNHTRNASSLSPVRPKPENLHGTTPKVMKTPGGITIPTPFVGGAGKSLFPSTMNYWLTMTASKPNQKVEAKLFDQDDEEEQFLPNSAEQQRYTQAELEQKVAQALEEARNRIRQEVQREQEALIQQKMSESKSVVSLQLQEHGAQWKQEHEAEIKLLKEKYERKIAEQKDQVALATRLAKTRLDEIETLEAELCELQRTASNEQELEKLQREKEELLQWKDRQAELDDKLSKAEQAAQEKEQQLIQRREQWETERSELLERITDFSQKVPALESKLESAQQQTASLELELATAQVAYQDELEEYQQKLQQVTEQYQSTEPNKGTPSRTPQRRHSLSSPARSRLPTPSTSRISTPSRKNLVQERETENLRQQISVLEEQMANMSSEHENALQELRQASQAEIQTLKEDLERRAMEYHEKERELQECLSEASTREKEDLLEKIEELEAEKRLDRSGGLREVQKKEELLNKISALEKKEQEMQLDYERALQDMRAQSECEIQRLKEEMEAQQDKSYARERQLSHAISETKSFEKEDLLNQLETLQSQLESEKNCAMLVKMKIAALEKAAKTTEKDHKDEMDVLKSSMESEVKNLKSRVEELSAIEESKNWIEKERDELIEKVKQLEKNGSNKQAEDRVAQLKKTLADKEAEWNRTEEKIHAELASLKVKLEVATTKGSELQFEIDKLRAQSSSTSNQSIDEQLAASRKQYEDRIRHINESHSKELDELLAQLDLVEAEHKEKVEGYGKTLSEKESVINALGSQLSDSLNRAKDFEKEAERMSQQMFVYKEEADESQRKLSEVTKELQALQKKHNKFVADAEQAKELACEVAREEMIQRAEEQFKQANELYVKLKKQYDISKAKVEKLDAELKAVTSKADALKKDNEQIEIDLKAEIAELKAANAKIEADTAKKAKEYRGEMSRLLQSTQDFEDRVKEAEAANQAAQSSLEAIVCDKDRLQRKYDAILQENEELRQLSEELMSELERKATGHALEC